MVNKGLIKRIGSWVGTFKNYFSEMQKDISDVETSFEEDITDKNESSKIKDNTKKNE